jgi:hypothetical protein
MGYIRPLVPVVVLSLLAPRLRAQSAEAGQFFESGVRPVLASNSYAHHTGALGLSVRVDAYNVPNRTNLLEAAADLNRNNFGRSTDTLPAKACQTGVRIKF